MGKERLSGRAKPRGFRRWFFRAPGWLFRLGLGRFMPWWVLLTTTGRRTGRRRGTVVDIVARDGGAIYVLAAYGEGADWVRNLRAEPRLVAETAGRRFHAHATILAGADAGALVVELSRRRPWYTRAALRGAGLEAGTEEAMRAAGARMLVVRIAPAE